MSEFECRNGHLMRSRDRICLICSSPVYRMDGFTGKELEMAEKEEDYYSREEMEEEKDDTHIG